LVGEAKQGATSFVKFGWKAVIFTNNARDFHNCNTKISSVLCLYLKKEINHESAETKMKV
jgi:hypothetical protein